MAAVDYGADAVYIGGSKFGARRGACNPVEEVARAVEYAHQYGVRIHATLNTLLFDDELAEAEAEARAPSSCRTWRCGAWGFPSNCTPRPRCAT